MYQVNRDYRVGAVLLAAGEGRRFGASHPKQFQSLAGRAVFEYSLEVLVNSPWIDQVNLVLPPSYIPELSNVSPKVKFVEGGATRQRSSYLGLSHFDPWPDFVLIHDAVRPFLTDDLIKQNLVAAFQYGAVNTCISCEDTLVVTEDGDHILHIPPRNQFLRGQTPQTFRYALIKEAHERAPSALLVTCTDDCSLVLALGYPVNIVQGATTNLKITTPFDLSLAEHLVERSLGAV
jgi:2-C-methyl-D-erythritol 4-phosphate cytidylyltransferase